MAMTIKPIFTLKEALKSLWRNRLMSIASISSVSATLMILGIIFALIININAMAQSAKDQFDTIQAYLVDTLPAAEIETIMTEIEAIKGVQSVAYESKGDALAKMKASWKDNAYLLDGLEENPLPSSVVIYLEDIYYSSGVLEGIKEKDAEKAAKYSEIHIDEFVMKIKKELL